MTLLTFTTPSPITVVLDLSVADVRFVVSDRADTTVEVRPGDLSRQAGVQAAESTRVDYDAATRTLTVASKSPVDRFFDVNDRPPESIDIVLRLPSDSDVHGRTEIGDFRSDGMLGAVALATRLGTIRLAETGPLTVHCGVGDITVEGVSGTADVHAGSGDIRIGAIDGTADISVGTGRLRLGVVTGPTSLQAANGSVFVERSLSDITAASAHGEVRISEVVSGRVSAMSRNGAVEVGVRDGSGARLELSTGTGSVYSELDASDVPVTGEPLDRVDVHASTTLGNVTIRRMPSLEEAA